MRNIDRLCRAPSRASDASDSVRRLYRRLGEALSIRRGKGTKCGDADPDAPWLGTGRSNLSSALYFAIHSGRHQGAGYWFNELQRISTSPADAVRNFIAAGDTDVSALLSQVTVPTLVMHAREDARVPFEQGRRLAAGIPGARFVSLPSRNHLILENEPAFQRFLQELRTFLAS